MEVLYWVIAIFFGLPVVAVLGFAGVLIAATVLSLFIVVWLFVVQQLLILMKRPVTAQKVKGLMDKIMNTVMS